MTIIPISFMYKGVAYSASVQKMEGFGSSPTQYQVQEISPELNIHSGIYLVNTNRDGLKWTPDPIHPELPSHIAMAIKEGCEKAAIPVFT